jgi:hypothetical protein
MTEYFSSPWFGEYAKQALEQIRQGKVAGVTSKGVFLLFDKKSVFLTPIKEKSPFNIYLNEENAFFEKFSQGDEVFYSLNEVLIPNCKVTIDLNAAEVWTPPLPKFLTTSLPERLSRVSSLLKKLQQSASTDKGFLTLLNSKTLETQQYRKVMESIKKLQLGFQNTDLSGCLAAADGLFGLGTGLTPSGDDLLAGFLLYHVRFDQADKLERPFVAKLGLALTEAAYSRTTWISANRIEAACRGWSEELFLEVIDHLFDPAVELSENVVHRLLGFGHSSGVDTVLGVAAAEGAI